MPESTFKRVLVALARWIDSYAGGEPKANAPQETDWLRVVPFAAVHLMCLAVIWVGWSPIAVAVAIAMYFIRMFAITGFYHRYFSHRSFKTSRAAQFIFAVMGNSSVQRGPLWWASHHRLHHQHSDQPADVHSPIQHGFIWSHIGWITSDTNFLTRTRVVRDLAKYPELVFMDRFDIIVPTVLGFAMYGFGAMLAHYFPGLHTSGGQMLIWGFFISTVVLAHGTFTINSLAHVFGRRRYVTGDDSRNSFALAMITMGEGWHNNHHHYPASTRQGFYWWEVDVTYYILKVMSWLGIVWDLRPVPQHLLDEGRIVRPERALTTAKITTVIREAIPQPPVADEGASG
ncbi:MAG TPA: acyl-CoA desaturase [Candidatus Binataceae bacterium]|nr:acyl-CoA desaturase [Candidatus Binataceae bacterium]